MEFNQYIDAAINAHIQWFSRVRKAILTGKSDLDPKVVRDDKVCDFGMWLYSDLKQRCGTKPIFEEIRLTHARFHALAGYIMEKAIAGKREEVDLLMDFAGEFNQLSGKLILKLIALKDEC